VQVRGASNTDFQLFKNVFDTFYSKYGHFKDIVRFSRATCVAQRGGGEGLNLAYIAVVNMEIRGWIYLIFGNWAVFV
jgi:hypothetical protein